VKNLQSTNELSAETSLSQLVGELVLKVADVRLKVIALSYFDYEEVMVILGFPQEVYWVRNAFVISSNCGANVVVENIINSMPHLSD